MEYLFGKKKKKKRNKVESTCLVRLVPFFFFLLLLFLLFPLHLKKGEKEKTCTNFGSFDERSILSVA